MRQAWDSEEIFVSGDRFFQRLLAEVEEAKESIRFESYIFDEDALGKRVIAALARAAKRGVSVRVLLDGAGTANWTLFDLKRLEELGLDVRVYHPLPWQSEKLGFLDFFRARNVMKRVYQLNRRNHRKSCLIDQHAAFLGSMNVSARHLREFHGEDAWRDSGVRVSGPELRLLEEAFDVAWAASAPGGSTHAVASHAGQPRRDALLRLNLTKKARKLNYQDLIKRILQAKRRVWITTPYFVPELALLRALRFSAWSGVDVRLLVPHRNDIFFMKALAQAFYSVLQRTGVRIYEYLPAVLHAKTCLIDDWVVIGSSNLNSRSLIHDLEVDVVLKERSSIACARRQFEIDLERSLEVLPARWRRRLWARRILEWLALRLRHWA